MPNRAQRRAAERLARNAARQAAVPTQNPAAAPLPQPVAEPRAELMAEPLAEPIGEPTPEPSPARVAANRVNAQRSTGPITAEGKAKVSLNAVKTALTGRTVVLPSDDAAAYQSHMLAYQNEFNPVGAQETDLVASVANSMWRLQRIACLEQNLYAKGFVEFAPLFAASDPSQRAALIELHTHQAYEKQFRNLQLQEARLVRRREKEIAEIRQLQQERRQKHHDALEKAAGLYLAAREEGKTWEPAPNGFEFSTDAIHEFLDSIRAARRAQEAIKKEVSRPKTTAQAA